MFDTIGGETYTHDGMCVYIYIYIYMCVCTVVSDSSRSSTTADLTAGTEQLITMAVRLETTLRHTMSSFCCGYFHAGKHFLPQF